MSTHKAIVERYFDAVRAGDHERILSYVTDDILWEILGLVRVRGKQELDGVIDNDALAGRPTLTIDQLIEEGDHVVAAGSGSVGLAAGGRVEFLFCDIFTFRGDAISHLASYQTNLNGTGLDFWQNR
ncbi:MAG TPA: nuclear transport factor 2 family protein [Pseudonocardiaceae bacterium]